MKIKNIQSITVKDKAAMFIVRLILVSIVGLLLFCASCAPLPRKVWTKPNFTQGEFAKDKYDCLQQSQQSKSSAIGAYCAGNYCQPGQADSRVITNWDLFNACMEARGWSLVEERQE